MNAQEHGLRRFLRQADARPDIGRLARRDRRSFRVVQRYILCAQHTRPLPEEGKQVVHAQRDLQIEAAFPHAGARQCPAVLSTVPGIHNDGRPGFPGKYGNGAPHTGERHRRQQCRRADQRIEPGGFDPVLHSEHPHSTLCGCGKFMTGAA